MQSSAGASRCSVIMGNTGGKSHHDMNQDPVFVDYFDPTHQKWRSAQIASEDERSDSYQIVFWTDSGGETVVRVPRQSSNVRPHGSFTARQRIDSNTGMGVVHDAHVPAVAVSAVDAPHSSSAGSHSQAIVAGTVVSKPTTRAVRKEVHATPLPTTHVTPARSNSRSALQPQFPRDLAQQDDDTELGALLYLTATANIPGGRVDTSGSIAVGDMIDIKKRGAHTEWAMAEVLRMRRDVNQTPWVQIQMLEERCSPEWIPFESDRIAPSGKRAGVTMHPYSAGQMLDILDMYTNKYGFPQETWRLATVVAIDCTRIKVHFEGWSSRWDTWIDVATEAGKRRVAKAFRHTGNATDAGTLKKVQDESFRAKLKEEGFEIYEMASDGNCLFRAVAHQIHGDASHHDIVRQQCCDYMEQNRDHFQAFADEGSFEAYISTMRNPTTWGGDLEIHAMEEMYDHPIAIYSGDAEDPSKPMNYNALIEKEKLHGLRGSERITLSYHGKSHYNSILHFNATLPLTRRRTPGALRLARLAGKSPSVLSSPNSRRGSLLPRSPEHESKVDDTDSHASRVPRQSASPPRTPHSKNGADAPDVVASVIVGTPVALPSPTDDGIVAATPVSSNNKNNAQESVVESDRVN